MNSAFQHGFLSTLLVEQLQMLVDDKMHKDRFQVLGIADEGLRDKPQKHAHAPQINGEKIIAEKPTLRRYSTPGTSQDRPQSAADNPGRSPDARATANTG